LFVSAGILRPGRAILEGFLGASLPSNGGDLCLGDAWVEIAKTVAAMARADHDRRFDTVRTASWFRMLSAIFAIPTNMLHVVAKQETHRETLAGFDCRLPRLVEDAPGLPPAPDPDPQQPDAALHRPAVKILNFVLETNS
jgi:hypothetical protein